MRIVDHLLDAVIVGGGYAGLSCGLTLQKEKKSFLLLEASDYVGGRILDRVINKDFRLELGGQYIAPIQARA